MTTNPPQPTKTDPEAPLRELAKQFPEPDWREVAADRFWLADEQAKGTMDAYDGKVVAVYNKQIVGVGEDYVVMLLELSPKYNVHPGRIAVVYLGE